MTHKQAAEIDVGFPIYGLRFLNNNTVLACGGGGEGNNGIPNKITAIRCSFTVSDKNRRLQKFREVTLPSNEDSPMCIDFSHVVPDDNHRYAIYVGCNQLTELVRSMSINNNLRKYVFTDDEHLQFQDAVQFDDNLLVESIGEYPKIIHLASNAPVGAMMTSHIPSEIFIFKPDTLELMLRYQPVSPTEVKDFHLNPSDGASTLTYITASAIETISTSSGASISSSHTADKKTAKALGKYFFSKLRYVDKSKVIVTAALRNGKGAAVILYDTEQKRVLREQLVSKKIKGMVAIDVSVTANLIAVAGNDFSVTFLRLGDLKVTNTYRNLHKFAITCISFSPNGKKLATGSASNTLNVLPVGASSRGFFGWIGFFVKYLFVSFVVLCLSIFLKNAHDNGKLEIYLTILEKLSEDFVLNSRHYGEIGFRLSQEYGAEYAALAQHYGKIGFDIVSEKGVEGYHLLCEQISSLTAPKSNQPQEDVDDWTTHEAPATETLSTLNDVVSEVTKNIDELTATAHPDAYSLIIDEAVSIGIVGTELPASETPSGTPVAESIQLETTSSLHIDTKSVEEESVSTLSFHTPHVAETVESVKEEIVSILPIDVESVQEEIVSILPVDLESVQEQVVSILPVDIDSVEEEVFSILPIDVDSVQEEVFSILPIDVDSVKEEMVSILPVDTNSVKEEAASVLPIDVKSVKEDVVSSIKEESVYPVAETSSDSSQETSSLVATLSKSVVQEISLTSSKPVASFELSPQGPSSTSRLSGISTPTASGSSAATSSESRESALTLSSSQAISGEQVQVNETKSVQSVQSSQSQSNTKVQSAPASSSLESATVAQTSLHLKVIEKLETLTSVETSIVTLLTHKPSTILTSSQSQVANSVLSSEAKTEQASPSVVSQAKPSLSSQRLSAHTTSSTPSLKPVQTSSVSLTSAAATQSEAKSQPQAPPVSSVSTKAAVEATQNAAEQKKPEVEIKQSSQTTTVAEVQSKQKLESISSSAPAKQSQDEKSEVSSKQPVLANLVKPPQSSSTTALSSHKPKSQQVEDTPNSSQAPESTIKLSSKTSLVGLSTHQSSSLASSTSHAKQLSAETESSEQKPVDGTSDTVKVSSNLVKSSSNTVGSFSNTVKSSSNTVSSTVNSSSNSSASSTSTLASASTLAKAERPNTPTKDPHDEL